MGQLLMSSSTQTILALVVVALAAAWLLRGWFGKKKSSGCGSEGCGAVSPEVKKLQRHLQRCLLPPASRDAPAGHEDSGANRCG